LGQQSGLDRGELLEHSFTQRLHIRTELHHLLVGGSAGRIDSTPVALLGMGRELGLRAESTARAGADGGG
jgi:hypothetical protein